MVVRECRQALLARRLLAQAAVVVALRLVVLVLVETAGVATVLLRLRHRMESPIRAAEVEVVEETLRLVLAVRAS
jgi:hypothetical protein